MCTNPTPAFQLKKQYWPNKDKQPQPKFNAKFQWDPQYIPLPLPCGKCVSCLKIRSMTRAVQLACELQTTEGDSLFVTLTYNNENLPEGHTLNFKHAQDFMKRLREKASRMYPGIKIRFDLIGEYGEKTYRPHLHYALFGLPQFKDQKESELKSDHKMYESEILTELWGKGRVVYNLLTEASCLYMAQHSDKKINRKIDYSAQLIDAETGEVIEPPTLPFIKKDDKGRRILDADGKPIIVMLKQRVPEFHTGSTQPGIGTQWYEQFGHTDLNEGRLLSLDLKPHKIPRHLMNLMERDNPDLHELLKLEAKVHAEENQKTPAQLKYQDDYDRANLKYKTKRNKL